MKSRNNSRTEWSMKRVAQHCSVPIQRLVGDRLYLKALFKQKMGYKLDLNNPRTFSEKLQWLKLNDRKPLYTQLVDKYEVKKYIAQKIGEEYVIPTLGVYKKFDDIDFEKLPKQFVIKCTHDSGGLVICKDKDKLDIEAARKTIQKALRRNYFWYGREWPYKNVKPRIIVEQYIEDTETRDLKDYKFFTFSGEIGCVLVDLDRFTNHTRAIYDRNWKRMPFTETFPTDYNVEQKCPKNFDKMVALVEKIAGTIGNPPHARIDLYTVGGNIYVGEITFFHGSGFAKFDPPEWDVRMGNMIDIGETKKNKKIRRIMRVLFPWKSIHNGLYEAYARYHERTKVGIKNEYFSHKIYKKYHCHVSPLADIGEGTIFPHPIGIVIGRWARIGRDCTIYQNVTIGRRNPSEEYDIAEIGDNVLVGCNSIILGKVKIGSGAKIAAGSIVLRDVKPGETVHGVVK